MSVSKLSGFTIVELLIIVVVIAVLARIVIVTYSDAQIRARNSQTAVAVREYKDALVLTMQNTGAYPEPTTAGTSPCLGNAYTTTTCWFGSGTVDTTFMANLNKVLGGGSLPMPAMPRVTLKGVMYSPPSKGFRVDGASYAAATPVSMITYSVEGANTACPVGQVASKPSNGNVFWFSSTPPPTGQTYAPSGSNPAQCWLILPYK